MVLSIEELNRELRGFHGTENYYRHFTGLLNYTDGVKHLAERAKAYWLIDAISSWQCEKHIIHGKFQIWTLTVKDSKAVLEMKEDTGSPTLVKQDIEFTNFPEGEIKVYVIDGVLLLPSEY